MKCRDTKTGEVVEAKLRAFGVWFIRRSHGKWVAIGPGDFRDRFEPVEDE